MAEQDYREKIKKLLALSESSNEHEAKSALLKAKKLMAEHKIAEIDLKDIDKKKVIHTTTEFRCSKRREAWMIGLATTIAENFCCQSYRTKVYNKQLSTICFVGFEDDIEACTEIFKYAVDCIRNGITDLKKESVNYSKEYTKHLGDGYGFGYVQGIKKAFEVYCDIIDEAGGIAAIATILASNGLSIKNIGIVHNREFEEGVLRIEFYDESSSKKAAELLQKFRYIVYER